MMNAIFVLAYVMVLCAPFMILSMIIECIIDKIEKRKKKKNKKFYW